MDSGLMERFVYVQQGESFEKRLVKVGVSDYFYAEIQEGLTSGEVVSIEMPKEEIEKKSRQIASRVPLPGPHPSTSVVTNATKTASAGPSLGSASAVATPARAASAK
jgi:hypothetical protein